MNLRELAEEAIGAEFDWASHHGSKGYEARETAMQALLAAIEQCEKDAALGANVRAVVEMDGDLGLFEAQGNLFIAGSLNAIAPDDPSPADTLDEAVSFYRARLETK